MQTVSLVLLLRMVNSQVVEEMHFYFARGETHYGSNPKNKYRVELTSV